MKRNLLLSLLTIFTLLLTYSWSFSQCQPGNYTQGGFYPGMGSPIHPAAATAPYSLTVTIVVPKDTLIAPLPRLPIDSAMIKEFIGFPAGFNFDYNPSGQWLPGDSAGCVLISGTPNANDVGTHSISVVFTVVIMGFAYTDTISDFWTLEVHDDTHVGLEFVTGEDNIKIFPNPAKNHIWVNYNTANGEDITLTIYSNTGIPVKKITADVKYNAPYRVDTESLPAGNYFLTVQSKEGVVAKRFVIL